HYHAKPDVNEIARSVHMSTPAFCRYFKKQTHMTFTDFINRYRIDMAKNLLMQEKTVGEACYAVGFESLSYFNKLFNAIEGQNPSQFRKTWQGRSGV
ncbi:MAG: helix-turn-helix transcriptional regulator, partial [Mucilaginibacter polytrichastri]|nr:helix-turn-helix transcriptional regulator [Mucilaginibacter polytrichastri]